jgi:hypothetical protein
VHAGLIADGNRPLAFSIAVRVAGQLADQILVKVALQDISQLTYIGWDAFWLVDGLFSYNMRRTGERSSHPKRPSPRHWWAWCSAFPRKRRVASPIACRSWTRRQFCGYGIACRGTVTRVAHYEQPVFAWR